MTVDGRLPFSLGGIIAQPLLMVVEEFATIADVDVTEDDDANVEEMICVEDMDTCSKLKTYIIEFIESTDNKKNI